MITEVEWSNSDNTESMIELIRRIGSARRLRLFCCACCREVRELLADDRSRRAVEIAERYADGEVGKSELDAARLSAKAATNDSNDLYQRRVYGVAYAAACATYKRIEKVVQLVAFKTQDAVQLLAWRALRLDDDGIFQRELLCDIFGNPFRSVTLDPRWLSSTVRDLAEVIYQERAFERMPILGDALMDAGCDDEQVIQHCQGHGPHVRGCWVVDLVTGRK